MKTPFAHCLPPLALLCVLFLATATAAAAGGSARSQAQCPVVPLQVERLPDLNMPRSGHALVWAGGEPLVVGGHTSGFIPTATAEYYSDGQWHLLPTVYKHDDGLTLLLRSGQVLVAGGHEKNLGIGQTFEVERYDPVAHRFEGFGCLDRKRTLFSAVELDSGRVLISGNWYERDEIELFDGRKFFTHVKPVSTPRAAPFMFRMSDGDALILAGQDTCGHSLDSIVVDRWCGEPFSVPLLREWIPLPCEGHQRDGYASFVGDEAKDEYAYLMPVARRDGYKAGNPWCRPQLGIVRVQDTRFELLPTAAPIPRCSPAGHAIHWFTHVIADRQRGRGYVLGIDSLSSVCILAFDYTRAPMPVCLYYMERNDWLGFSVPVLMPDGNLLMAGGIWNDNFAPFASAAILRVSPDAASSLQRASGWGWWLAALAGVLALVGLMARLRQHKLRQAATAPSQLRPTGSGANGPAPGGASCPAEIGEAVGPGGGTDQPGVVLVQQPGGAAVQPLGGGAALSPAVPSVGGAIVPEGSPSGSSDSLMPRLRQLMEEERLFLNSELKVSDVATRLGTNVRYVSGCLKAEGINFNSFVNTYRVAYAQQLLQRQPDIKMAAVAAESGFSGTSSFFRTFKAVTGVTPSEWREGR